MKTYQSMFSTVAILMAVGFSSAAMAVPVLQLGPGSTSDPNWNYDTAEETWIHSGSNEATLAAYALNGAFKECSSSSGCSGPSSSSGSTLRTAYLSIAATPKTPDATDVFDVTVTNNGSALSLFESGHGAPPISDTNPLDNTRHDLRSHGIFDTYFEVYEFTFDESVHHVPNTQTGSTSNSDGWLELFNIKINSIDPKVTGLHFDLYTLNCDDLTVYKFAPFSHDAGMDIPEPTPLLLSGVGLMLASMFGTRRAFARKA